VCGTRFLDSASEFKIGIRLHHPPGSIGALWMMYMSVRYEKNPLPMVLLAFVAYAFLWFYVERVRPKKYQERRI
jgi:4-hydroxybenzoate polyprenyltransferase